jgi:hypothetical protein
MTFEELRAAVDERLESEPRLRGIQHDPNAGLWMLNQETVVLSPSGSTGILVEYLSRDRLVRTKIFAASPMSVERIVTTSAEHLTSYVFHRTSTAP